MGSSEGSKHTGKEIEDPVRKDNGVGFFNINSSLLEDRRLVGVRRSMILLEQ